MRRQVPVASGSSRIQYESRIHTARVVDRSPRALRPRAFVVVRPQRRQPTRPACRQVRQSQRQDAQGEAHERRASSSWSWLLPQPRTLRLRHLCAQSSFFSSPCSSTGARCIRTASQRMSDRTVPLRVRVACLLRSLENKPAGSQCGTNVARGSAFESAVLEHRRLLPDQANTVPFVALGAHLLRCNPSNHTRPYALQSCMYLYGQCAVDVCECMPTQLYASARLVSTRSSRNSD